MTRPHDAQTPKTDALDRLRPPSEWAAKQSYRRLARQLERELQGVREETIEECAKIAEQYWQTYIDTKEAHERNCALPFYPAAFGLSLGRAKNSREMADSIRDLSRSVPAMGEE